MHEVGAAALFFLEHQLSGLTESWGLAHRDDHYIGRGIHGQSSIRDERTSSRWNMQLFIEFDLTIFDFRRRSFAGKCCCGVRMQLDVDQQCGLDYHHIRSEWQWRRNGELLRGPQHRGNKPHGNNYDSWPNINRQSSWNSNSRRWMHLYTKPNHRLGGIGGWFRTSVGSHFHRMLLDSEQQYGLAPHHIGG